MKILFVCGSLEAGKDGVGDYTRRLAGELIGQGHQCQIIAVMDCFVSEIVKQTQYLNGLSIDVIRFPVFYGLKNNCSEAVSLINGFNPEWISLQYVPFAFHSKGLPLKLGKYVNLLAKDRKLHIMFHELWAGMNNESSYKLVVLSRLQRQLLILFIKRTRPVKMHTQTRLYVNYLNNLGIRVTRMPLFSNIIRKSFPQESVSLNKEVIKFVVFGGIHAGAPISLFANDISSYCKENKISAILTFLGRCGSEQSEWVRSWEHEGLNVNLIGEQNNDKVSEILMDANIGIATTPMALIEKSGSVAAMLEHGLPVICLSKKWNPTNVKKPLPTDGIREYMPGKPINYLSLKKTEYSENISTISSQFLHDLR